MTNFMNKIIAKDLDFIVNSNIIDWKKFRDKTFLITGAYGMLLSYMAYVLLWLNKKDPSFNIKVIALVRNKEKAKQRFKDFINSKDLKIFEHDLSSSIDISDDIDFIVHGASYASPHYFKTKPVDVLLPNVIGTYNLLELAKAKKVEGFLFFSSGAVYGKNATEVVTENDYGFLNPLDMVSCYSESKRMAENMCKCWHDQFGLPVKIVRPAHIYGPTMDIDNDSRVFASFVRNIVKKENIVMKSNGSAWRSFCYIADATVAFFKVLFDGAGGEAYNIGNDNAYMSVKKLAEIFISTFKDNKLSLIMQNDNTVIDKRENKMLMSSKKIERLGWQCFFPIPEGLKRTVESFLSDC